MVDYNVSMDRFWIFENICHQAGLYDYLDYLLRTLQTRDALSGENITSSEEVYRTMQKATAELPRFQGDADLFYQIYNSLCDIDAYGIVNFISLFNKNRKEFTAPDVLVDKFAQYIGASTKTVFVAECQQYGIGLLNVIEDHPNIEFTLCTKNEIWRKILNYVYGSYKNVNLLIADIYTDGFVNNRYDLIFAIPVFGAREPYEEQDFICKDSDMIAVQNLLYHIEFEGQLVIILPAKITFGSGSIASLRNYIETNYKIKEISALPAGLFIPYTSIRTYMFVFGNGATEEVMIRKYELDKAARKIGPYCKLILDREEMLFPDEFADLTGWNIDLAFGEQDDDMRAYALSNVKKVLLKNVATVFRGKAVNGGEDSGNVRVINISNLSDTGINYPDLELICEDERKVARYVLEEGDVLVTSRGTTIKIAVFEKQSMPCIPSANLIVIRPDSSLKGAYLKLFLESPVGIKMLKGLQRGTTVMNINYKDLNDLEIPLLPLDEQESIIRDYEEGLSFYKETLAAAEEAWTGVKNNIQSRLY